MSTDNSIKVGDRVVVAVGGEELKVNTVGTVEQFLSDSVAVLRYDFDEKEKREKFIGVQPSSLRPAVINEINNVTDIRKLLNKRFNIGSFWRADKGFKVVDDADDKVDQIVEIVKVELGTNVSKDNYYVKLVGDKFQGRGLIKLPRKTLEECFIDVNLEIESQLAKEIIDSGEYLDLRPGTRVKLKEGYEDNELDIKKNEVGVLIDSNEITGEAKFGITLGGKEHIVTTRLENVYPASDKDISETYREQIVEGRFLPGNEFVAKEEVKHVFQLNEFINVGEKITIIDIEAIKHYVLEDIFKVKHENGSSRKLSTYDLYSYFEHVPKQVINNLSVSSLNTNTREEEQAVETKEESKEKNNDLEKDNLFKGVVFHGLEIDGYSFRLQGDIVHSETLVRDYDIDKYIVALKKLQKILKKS